MTWWGHRISQVCNLERGREFMKVRSSFLRKAIAGILTSAMVFAMTPELPLQNTAVTVEAAQVKLNTKKVTLRKGETKKLKLKNVSGKIKWKSSKKSVVSVTSNGLVRAKKAGKATVTATYKKKQYKCAVTVKSSSKTSKSNTSGSKKTATVYWTPGGAVYHVSRNCPTLSRSRTVLSGSISDSKKSRACKVCS